MNPLLPEKIDELCRRLAEAEDLPAGMQAVAWACDEAFPFYRVVAALPRQESGRLYVAAAWARRPEEELAGFDFPIVGHPLERAVTENVPVVRHRPGEDHEDPRLARLYRGEEKAEELAVPLRLLGRTGLLVFASRAVGGFTDPASRWAEAVARVFAVWVRPWCGQDAPLALKEQYETLLESALDGIAVLKDGEIVYANPSFHEIFGMREDRRAGLSFDKLLSPASRQEFAEALTWVEQRSRLLPRFEVDATSERGVRLHLDVGLQAILYQGEPAYLLQVHNATDRALREKEVREARERTDALLLTLAHDIRAPLTTVHGFTELLTQRGGSIGEERAADMLGVVHRSSQSLKDLVEGLLEYSSLGGSKGRPQRVAMGVLLAAVEREIEGQIRGAEARIEYRGIPDAVWGRTVEVGRVFRNLMENAIRYGRTGVAPVVRVSCDRVEGDHHVFCVADNGCGIDAARRQEVFELFRRGESGGAGVGLAIVSRIVSGYGGRIWIEGEEGEGSRFYFTLPRAPDP